MTTTLIATPDPVDPDSPAEQEVALRRAVDDLVADGLPTVAISYRFDNAVVCIADDVETVERWAEHFGTPQRLDVTVGHRRYRRLWQCLSTDIELPSGHLRVEYVCDVDLIGGPAAALTVLS